MIPALLRQSVVEKVAELQRREFDLGRRARYPFEEVLRSWQEQVERTFLSSFVVSLDPVARQQVWNPVATPQILDRVMPPLDEAITAVEDDLLEGLEDEEEESYRLGLLYGLWGLSLSGEDVEDYPMPEEGRYRSLVAAAAFAGLPLAARLRSWGDIYREKLRATLKGAIVSGSTLPETLGPLQTLGKGLVNHAGALVTNEVFRAFMHGERKAYEDFEVGWVWFTRADERVCEVCAPLHLTITTKVPVDDTHPDCRCSIVPYRTGYTPRPSSFAAFAQRFSV